MRNIIRALVVALSAGLALAPLAAGKAVTRQHARQYQRAYRQVVRTQGRRAPGRNIIRWGVRGRPATDRQVQASLAVLDRMLAPAPVAVVTQASPVQASPAPASSRAQPQSYTATAPSSGLAACIIARESGGNTQATNGQYSGIAQWSPTSWAGGGGTRYAPSPSQASYSQQVTVLNNMLAAGQAGQWTPYDGC